MRAALKVILGALKVLTLLLTFLNDERLRREGERRAHRRQQKEAKRQQEVANEIDEQVADGLSAADLERMRKYQRTSE